jgi:hypothetical protein
MKKRYLLALILLTTYSTLFAQLKSDSVDLEKLRKESGIDPTRVQSRAGYSLLMFDQQGSAGQINNRLSLNLGVNTWNFAMKYDVISLTTGEPGTGFTSGMGDIRFSVLNAFYVAGKHALAASAEFSMPTGKPGFGSQYFSATPAITYSYTIKPSLIMAIQPQYTFQLMKDPLYPNLSVLTIRSFLAKFTKTGYFFVFEPRPIFDFGNNTVDFIISPIIGKSLGAGFNLIALAEIPVTNTYRDNKGMLYQLGFNKNF